MPLSTGAQLHAARAMVDMEQTQLATAAKVAVGTVYKLERQRDRFSGAKVDTVRRLQEALEAAGITFIDDDGVKLRRKPA